MDSHCIFRRALFCNRLVMEAKERRGGSGEPKIRKSILSATSILPKTCPVLSFSFILTT